MLTQFDRAVYGRLVVAPTNAVRLMFPDVILSEVSIVVILERSEESQCEQSRRI